MGEFASHGVANAGLTTGIIGTSLAGLMALNGNNGNGLLGGLFGGNGNQVSGLMSEIAKLKSEKYTDGKIADVYAASRSENQKLRDDIFLYIKPLADEAAANRERVAVLEAQQAKNIEINDLREKLVRSELGARIDTVAQTCGCGIAQNANAIAALQAVVNGITSTVVPASAICPAVMPRYNSYVAPTDTAPATQPISGTVSVRQA